MRLLLSILLSFLLLTSPLFSQSQQGEVLYRWETSSGIVWKRFGDKETHTVYKGEVENGKPNGLGIMKYVDGSKYVGEWKKGKRDGWGTIIMSNGEKYRRKWKDGFEIKSWTKQLGTSTNDRGEGVTIDSSNNIYVTGTTKGGLDGNTNSGDFDIFLVKYNSSGVKQ